MPTYGEMRSEVEKEIDRRVLARVQRGITLLKEKHGEDWVNHIDPSTLDLSNGSRCILGQVYQGYDDIGYTVGKRLLFGPEEVFAEQEDLAIKHGFATTEGETWYELQITWAYALEQLGLDVSEVPIRRG